MRRHWVPASSGSARRAPEYADQTYFLQGPGSGEFDHQTYLLAEIHPFYFDCSPWLPLTLYMGAQPRTNNNLYLGIYRIFPDVRRFFGKKIGNFSENKIFILSKVPTRPLVNCKIIMNI